MRQARLNSLDIISIENEHAECVNFDDVINRLADAKACRIRVKFIPKLFVTLAAPKFFGQLPNHITPATSFIFSQAETKNIFYTPSSIFFFYFLFYCNEVQNNPEYPLHNCLVDSGVSSKVWARVSSAPCATQDDESSALDREIQC